MKLANLSLLSEMTLQSRKGSLARVTEANRESHRLRLIGAFVLFMPYSHAQDGDPPLSDSTRRG